MVYVPNDPGTEAEALNDWLDSAEGAYEEREFYQQDRMDAATARYNAAKAAKVGDTPPCGWCARPFTKKSYQQAFCCNKGAQNCKDNYWNRANPRGMGLFL